MKITNNAFIDHMIELFVYIMAIVLCSAIYQLIFYIPELGGYQKPLFVYITGILTFKNLYLPKAFEKFYAEIKKNEENSIINSFGPKNK